MDYQEALEYLLRFADYERLPRSGIVWDIKRIERLLERVGNPQHAARSVHVAGTKGKGSASAMIASVLAQAGYRTGLYTSPHLLSFTERIQVDGKNISEEDWARLTEFIKPHVEAENRLGDLGELTTFEIMTAMAFIHFQEVKVDYQVIEVGLGGRLDATNVVRPQVCVVTSISYDHTDVLGETLTEIATEKAGIIKSGSTVVSAPQFPEAMAVIEGVCRERGVRLVRVGADVTWREGSFNTEGQSFQLKGVNRDYFIRIPLLGEHQVQNAAVAVAALESLGDEKITPENIAAGLEKVEWPGRLQVLRREPWVVVDGAHNTYSMQKLGEALKQYFKYDGLTLILGFSGDKNVGGMVAEAVKMTGDIILAASRHPRSVKTPLLVEEFSKRGVKVWVAESVAAAVKLALAGAAKNDLICAAGSVFVVAEVMEGVKSLEVL
ncbi:MAG: bifunctional folylpolyglutamate synthase/dihydrofolate synthase [Dehalococcoidales bacterium]|nr:bifunctional folylpolyglutamate synthase/dihydrofolate synthase [Dehalococcoidales bacterium]